VSDGEYSLRARSFVKRGTICTGRIRELKRTLRTNFIAGFAGWGLKTKSQERGSKIAKGRPKAAERDRRIGKKASRVRGETISAKVGGAVCGCKEGGWNQSPYYPRHAVEVWYETKEQVKTSGWRG